MLSLNREKLYEALETFGESYEITVQKGTSILNVLKEVAGVKIKRIGDKEFVVSIDDEEGFFVYEVDGKTPDVPINDYKLEKDGTLEIKRLVPVVKKKLRVKLKADDGKST